MKNKLFITIVSIFISIFCNAQADSMIQWANTFPNSTMIGVAANYSDMQVDPFGNVYYAGSFTNTIDFDPSSGVDFRTSSGSSDGFITKIDANGNYVFTIVLEGELQTTVAKIRFNSLNELIVSGSFSGIVDLDPGISTFELNAGINANVVFLAKFTTSGNIINGIITNSISGPNLSCMKLDNNDKIYLGGNFTNTINLNPLGISPLMSNGGLDAFYVIYDPNLNYINSHSFGGISDDGIYDLIIDLSNRLQIIGYFSGVVDFDVSSNQVIRTSQGNTDAFWLTFDSNGSLTRAFTTGDANQDYFSEIIVDSQNRPVILGRFSGSFSVPLDNAPSPNNIYGTTTTIVVAKFENDTILNSTLLFNASNPNYPNNIQNIFNGDSIDVFVTGSFSGSITYPTNLTSSGGTDGLIMRFGEWNDHFELRDASIIGGAGTQLVKHAQIGGTSKVLFTGTYVGVTDLDPSIGVNNVNTTLQNIMIGKLNGAYNQTLDWGGATSSYSNTTTYKENGTAILIDNNGNTYVGGNFQDTIDLDPGTGQFLLASMPSWHASTYCDSYLAKYDLNGNLVWGFKIGGDLTGDEIKKIFIDSQNNIIVYGAFRDSVDFDPGPGINIHFASNQTIYFAKYDANGNFINVINTNLNTIEISEVFKDETDNFFIGGPFDNGIDYDFGPSTYTFSGMYGGLFFAKYDSNFNLIFAKSFDQQLNGYAYPNRVSAINILENKDIVIGGCYEWTVDFDPGPGTYLLTSLQSGPSDEDGFLAVYDSLGNFKWIHNYANSNFFTEVKSIAPNGNSEFWSTIVGGNATTDFDFGPDTYTPQTGELTLVKYDSSGNFITAFTLKGGLSNKPEKIIKDQFNNIYLINHLNGECDVDPSPYTDYLLNSAGYTASAICKYDTDGNFIYALPFLGTNGTSNNLNDIHFNDNGDVVATGDFGSSTRLVNGSNEHIIVPSNGIDAFVAKYKEDLCSNFYIVLDTVADFTCSTGFGFSAVSVFNSLSPYTIQWNTSPVTLGDSSSFTMSGIYEVTVSNTDGCSKTKSIFVNGPEYPSGFDLNANLIANPFRVGFPATINLDALNDGCVPTTGQLILVLDPLVNYNNASPFPDSIVGDTLIWNFTDWTYDSLHILPVINVTTSLSASIGDLICFDLNMTPVSGDLDSTNNHRNYCFPVINGYDPNNKYVNPAGIGDNGYILSDQKLTYTINFQNTGNSEAINIFVTDTLDADLNLNTLDIISSSHPMVTEILPGNILKFEFDNIHLPDSSTNEPFSHGYLIYEIDPANPYDDGIVNNTANIFFDFNSAVITNTTHNIICDEWPTLASDLTPIGNLTICEGYGTSLLAQGNGIIRWYDENMNLIGIGNQINIPQIDSNSVFYGFDSTCYTHESGITLNVNVIPIPDNSVSYLNDTIFAIQTGATYQWMDCNSQQLVSGQTLDYFVPFANGDYALVVTQNGCSDTSLCINVTGLGVSEMSNDNYRLFPNPSNGNIKIEVNEPGYFLVEVIDLYGQIIFLNTFNSSKIEFTLPENISNGMYIARVTSESDSKERKIRFIYQK